MEVEADVDITLQATAENSFGRLDDEILWVVGGCEQLGDWCIENALSLKRENNDSTWSVVIKLPVSCIVQYKYFTTFSLSENQSIIYRWEGHGTTRLLTVAEHQGVGENIVKDIFGVIGNVANIHMGLSTVQTFVIFKFDRNSIRMCRPSLKEEKLRVKVMLYDHQSCSNYLSKNNGDKKKISTKFLIQSAILSDHSDPRFVRQSDFGCTFNPHGDYVIIQCQLLDHQSFIYRIEIFDNGQIPKLLGFCNVLPVHLHPDGIDSICELSINDDVGIIGHMTVEYSVVKPLPSNAKLNQSFHSYPRVIGDVSHTMLIGHRGCGSTFDDPVCPATILENSIKSFRCARHDMAADMVEMDVHLSKDKIPVIYHNFKVCANVNNKFDDDKQAVEMNLMDLTFEQLQRLSVDDVCGILSNDADNKILMSEKKDEEQPFPSLQSILSTIEPSLGFNLEIKYPMYYNDGIKETDKCWTDLNEFVDTILDVVFKLSGSRVIVFSSFSLDVCTMLRLKQSLYPVFLLICGKTKKYTPYKDSRTWSVPNAIMAARNIGLQGIAAMDEEILADMSLVDSVHRSDLQLFVWGDCIDSHEIISKLSDAHVDGIIYNKIDVLNRRSKKD